MGKERRAQNHFELNSDDFRSGGSIKDDVLIRVSSEGGNKDAETIAAKLFSTPLGVCVCVGSHSLHLMSCWRQYLCAVMALTDVCADLLPGYFSLGLVLPTYSENHIKANLSDQILQVQCKYLGIPSILHSLPLVSSLSLSFSVYLSPLPDRQEPPDSSSTPAPSCLHAVLYNGDVFSSHWLKKNRLN